MAKIAIITDGSADLPQDIIDRYNIYELPVRVMFGPEEFLIYNDSGGITKEEYYQRLRTCEEMPTTGIPSPQIYQPIIEKALNESDEVIGVFISEKLTRVIANVQQVLSTLNTPDNFTIIDSTVAAPTLGLLVIEAAKMAQNGASKEEIVAKIQELIPQANLVLVLDTLENIYRSGRMGRAQKFLGQALNIKPILHFEDGIVTGGGKITGRKEVIKRMKFIAPILLRHTITDYFFIWHTRNFVVAEEIYELLKNHNDKGTEIRITEAGPIIGGHIGEKALGFNYIGKYNKKWLLKMKE